MKTLKPGQHVRFFASLGTEEVLWDAIVDDIRVSGKTSVYAMKKCSYFKNDVECSYGQSVFVSSEMKNLEIVQ